MQKKMIKIVDSLKEMVVKFTTGKMFSKKTKLLVGAINVREIVKDYSALANKSQKEIGDHFAQLTFNGNKEVGKLRRHIQEHGWLNLERKMKVMPLVQYLFANDTLREGLLLMNKDNVDFIKVFEKATMLIDNGVSYSEVSKVCDGYYVLVGGYTRYYLIREAFMAYSSALEWVNNGNKKEFEMQVIDLDFYNINPFKGSENETYSKKVLKELRNDTTIAILSIMQADNDSATRNQTERAKLKTDGYIADLCVSAYNGSGSLKDKIEGKKSIFKVAGLQAPIVVQGWIASRIWELKPLLKKNPEKYPKLAGNVLNEKDTQQALVAFISKMLKTPFGVQKGCAPKKWGTFSRLEVLYEIFGFDFDNGEIADQEKFCEACEAIAEYWDSKRGTNITEDKMATLVAEIAITNIVRDNLPRTASSLKEEIMSYGNFETSHPEEINAIIYKFDKYGKDSVNPDEMETLINYLKGE